MRQCTYKNCAKVPNFNFAGCTPALYCKEHMEEGMVDVVTKRCLEPSCARHPSFNLEGNRTGVYCKKHAEEGMVDVRSQRCSQESCTTTPSFNVEGSTSAVYCKRHADEGMVNVNSKRCSRASCSTQPSFNFEGSKTAMTCKQHAQAGMVDVCSRRCSHAGCKKSPSFNVEGSKIAVYCKKHADSGMVCVLGRRCLHASCSKYPRFNVEGSTTPEYCKKHAGSAMVNVRSRRCLHALCNKRSIFNVDGEKRAVYCREHAEDGMVDVVSKRCSHNLCKKQPNFNFEGTKTRVYCKEHAEDGMIRLCAKRGLDCSGTKRPGHDAKRMTAAAAAAVNGNFHGEKGVVDVSFRRCSHELRTRWPSHDVKGSKIAESSHGMNKATTTFVEPLLVDDIAWYRSLVQAEQQKDKVLGHNALCTKLAQAYRAADRKPPSRATLLEYVKIATSFKEAALLTMKDVTYLNNREKGHPDFNTFGNARVHVTLKMLARPEFQDATEVQQEVYILRLASAYFTKLVNLNDKETARLDRCAVDVGLQVTQVEAIAPRQEWSTAFRTFVKKVMCKELTSKFVIQQYELEKEVERYKMTLPVGMKASEDYMGVLLGRPHRMFLDNMKEDDDMNAAWEKYNLGVIAAKERSDTGIDLYKQEAKENAEKTEAVEAAALAKASAEHPACLEKAARGDAVAEISPAGATDPSPGGSSHATTTPVASTATTTPGASSGGGKSKTDESKVAKTKNPKRKREPAGPVFSGGSQKSQRLAKLGSSVSKVLVQDIFNIGTKSTLPGMAEATLCFWNVASDTSILIPNPTAAGRMKRVVLELGRNIHSQGTLIIALGGLTTCSILHIAGVLASGGFTLEDNPVTSIYLACKTGRIADNKRNDYASHASVALVAHKSPHYVFRAGGVQGRASSRRASSSSSSGRGEAQSDAVLEAAGCIVSSEQPDAGTFLAHATAEHFIQRFSRPGDAILVTGAEHQSLASLVLGTGRTLIAVVGDGAKEAVVSKELEAACEEALWCGNLTSLCRPPRRVGGKLLPKCVPKISISESGMADTRTIDFVDLDDGDEDDDHDDGHANEKATKEDTPLVVAKKRAEVYGVEINVEIKKEST